MTAGCANFAQAMSEIHKRSIVGVARRTTFLLLRVGRNPKLEFVQFSWCSLRGTNWEQQRNGSCRRRRT